MPMPPGSINGFTYGFSSMSLMAGPQAPFGAVPVGASQTFGWKDISFDDGARRGEARTNLPVAIGRTRGEYSANGTLTFYKGYMEDFFTAIGLVSPTAGIYEATFTLFVSYYEPSNPLLPMLSRALLNCQIDKINEAAQAGTNPLEDRLSIYIQAIGRFSGSPASIPAYRWPFGQGRMPIGTSPDALGGSSFGSYPFGTR